jgi:hypothetical protein
MSAGGCWQRFALRGKGLADGQAHVPGGGPQVSLDRLRGPGEDTPGKPEDSRPEEQPVPREAAAPGRLHETRTEAEHARDVMSRPPVWRDEPPRPGPPPREGQDAGKGQAAADAPAVKAPAAEERLNRQVADLWTQKQELGEKNYKLEMENKLLRTRAEVDGEKNAGLEREKTILGRENAGLKQENAELRSAREAQDGKNAEHDKQIAQLQGTNAALWKKIEELDKKLDALTPGHGEVSKEPEEPSDSKHPSTEIGDRAGGGAADRGNRAKPERRWHLPSDTANNLFALAAGGAVTTAAEYVPHISPTYAGMGATGLGIGAGAVAWLRERRKAKNDEGHRSEGGEAGQGNAGPRDPG